MYISDDLGFLLFSFELPRNIFKGEVSTNKECFVFLSIQCGDLRKFTNFNITSS